MIGLVLLQRRVLVAFVTGGWGSFFGKYFNTEEATRATEHTEQARTALRAGIFPTLRVGMDFPGSGTDSVRLFIEGRGR